MTVGTNPSSLREALRLCFVTDRATVGRHRTLIDVVAEAISGGVTSVQLRDEISDAKEVFMRAQALAALLKPLKVPLIVNDRIDIALACGADGVHLGPCDIPISFARALLPPGTFIGLSARHMSDVLDAKRWQVDYLSIDTNARNSECFVDGALRGIAGLRLARKITSLPLVAAGGISVDNAKVLLDAGANGIVVGSAIGDALDPGLAARSLSEL
jgi:thiamine-phosphate pyrophosphorylase